MSNEILYVLLPDFASHEMVYLMEAISSDDTQLKANPKYVNKIVAPYPGSAAPALLLFQNTAAYLKEYCSSALQF